MNKLKGKVEAYVISTMEDNQRTSLLDNLAISVEKVEDEAGCSSSSSSSTGNKIINEGDNIVDFIECLLAVLDHELKQSRSSKNKLSFWSVIESISPKDTIQMIYRLDMRQSDQTRCHAWIRHSLKEGTLGSYLSMLCEDPALLKDHYKPSSFVRDTIKMDSAKSLINFAISSIDFEIDIETKTEKEKLKFRKNLDPAEVPQEISFLRTNSVSSINSTTSLESNSRRRKKTRGSSVNVVTISDGPTYNEDEYTNNINNTFSKDRKLSMLNSKPIDPQVHDTVSRINCNVDILLNKPELEILDSLNNETIKINNSPSTISLKHKNKSVQNNGTNKCSQIPSEQSISDGTGKRFLLNDTKTSDHTSSLCDNTDKLNISSVIQTDNDLDVTHKQTLCHDHSSINETAIPESKDKIVNTHKELSIHNQNENIKSSSSDEISNVPFATTLSKNSDITTSQSTAESFLEPNDLTSPQLITDKTLLNADSSLSTQNTERSDINTLSSLSIKNEITNNMTLYQPNITSSNTIETEHLEDISISKSVGISKNDEEDMLVNQGSPKIVISGTLNHSNGSLFKLVQDNSIKNLDYDIEFKDNLYSLPPSMKKSQSFDHKVQRIVSMISQEQPELKNEKIENENENKVLNQDYQSMDSIKQDNELRTCEIQSTLLKQDNIVNTSVEINSNASLCDSVSASSTTLSPLSSHSLSPSVEVEYHNQLSDDLVNKTDVEGSCQLENVLNSIDYSPKDTYFVPGIHTISDINKQEELKRTYTSPSKFQRITNCSPSSYTSEASYFKHREKQRSSTFVSASWDPNSPGKLDSSLCDLSSESGSCSTSEQSFSILADLGITDDFIGLKEDHFSSMDTFMGYSSTEELENAIGRCKILIKEAPEKSERKKDLVVQLVNLRLRLHEQKEKLSETPVKSHIKKILGHHFKSQGKIPSTMICDSCALTIFPLLQTVYMCRDCGFHCHRKCLKQLNKPCVNSTVKTSLTTYELRINPISSMAVQGYRCADCHKRFVLAADGNFACRLCDYTGMFYCAACHWNDSMVIPARIVHNWDFTIHTVSRQSKHSLLLMKKKPNINLKKLNPTLFNFVDELRDTRTLREQIIKMKHYVTSCRIAADERLLITLSNRQHFVDSADIYSLQDLIDLNSNILLDELTRKHTILAKHIKLDCLLCQGKGFICEICKADEIIFPFDNHAFQCHCKATLHRLCFSQNEKCPKCERNKKRKSKEMVNNEDEKG